MSVISGTLVTFHCKPDVCIILIIMTNITHAFDIYKHNVFCESVL